MLTRAHRLAVNHVRFGRAASLAPKLHRDAGFEPGGRKYGTTMRADHQGLAYFGKGRARLQAGNGDGKGDRHSRTAPHGLRHIRTMHVVPLSWCPAFLPRFADLRLQESVPLDLRTGSKLCTTTVTQPAPFKEFQ